MKLRRCCLILIFFLFLSLPSSAEGSRYGKHRSASAAEEDLLTEEKERGVNAPLTPDALQRSLDKIFRRNVSADIPATEAGTLTREQLAYAIVRRLNAEGIGLQYAFDDIWFSDADYFMASGYYEAARSLHRMGIMPAEDDGFFYPGYAVSLGQAEAILLRLASYVEDASSALNRLPQSTVGVSEAVDNAWFDDVCFIGHSQVVGMNLYGGMDNIDYYAVVGHTAKDVLTFDYYEMPNGRYGTLRQGLEFKNYGKIYLMLGINDCPNFKKIEETYFEPMKEILAMIEETQPQARIYILSLTPVGRWTNNNEWYNPENAIRYCQINKTLSRLYNTEYLDVYRLMSDSEGYFLENFDYGDGIHIHASAYYEFVAYLKTHT